LIFKVELTLVGALLVIPRTFQESSWMRLSRALSTFPPKMFCLEKFISLLLIGVKIDFVESIQADTLPRIFQEKFLNLVDFLDLRDEILW
jgi:hypothetical protein